MPNNFFEKKQRPSSLDEEGYTLIEILIVIVIISIVAGFAVLSINFNQNKRLEAIAKQLTNTFMLAETEAMLRPETLGFSLTENAFQFYEYHKTKDPEKNPWQAITNSTLKQHTLPSDVQITLKIQDKIISSDEPKLIFSPSGDITPFVILIGKKNSAPRYEITGHANGKITNEDAPSEE